MTARIVGTYSLAPRRVLSDDVYDTVTAILMDGAVVPGERINIEAIARELEVSPTPVRETLARLEAEGLVTKEPMKGYTATPILDAKGLGDLFEVRQLVEPHAARRAAGLITPARQAQLEETLRLMERSPGPDEVGGYAAYRQFVQADADFHQGIAAAADNSLLRECIARLRPHQHLYRLASRLGATSETVAEHRSVLAALAGGDAEGAEQAMRQHLRNTELRYRR